MDPAFDRFIAWCLRNPFHIPDDLRLVLVSLSERFKQIYLEADD
jgi:hypothetical protein